MEERRHQNMRAERCAHKTRVETSSIGYVCARADMAVMQGCMVAEWKVYLGVMFFECFGKYPNGRYFEVLWLKVCLLLGDGNLMELCFLKMRYKDQLNEVHRYSGFKRKGIRGHLCAGSLFFGGISFKKSQCP